MDFQSSNWLVIHQTFCEEQQAVLPKKQARQCISETESALIRLVLPLMGFSLPKGQKKLTKSIKQTAFTHMSSLKAKQLPKAARLFEQALPNLPLSTHSRNTYGSRGRNWFAWTQEARYWPGEQISPEMAAQCAPNSLHGHGSSKTISLTKRRGAYKQYSLTLDELNPRARQWFDEASLFLTRQNQPGRVFPPIAAYTLKMYQRSWLLIWGWQVHYNGVSLENLGPGHIFPVIDLDEFEELSSKQQNRLWKLKQRELEDIICGYRDFLLEEMKAFSPHTWHAKLVHMHAAGRVLYSDWVELPDDYDLLPIFKKMRAAYADIQDAVDERMQSPDVACLAGKWPDVPEGSTALHEFQQRVLEPMRLECRPRNHSRKLRSSRRIAHLHQKYLRAGMMGLLPPLRQQVDRSLKLALSCPVNRPKFVPPEGYYYPLPPDDIREHDSAGKLADNYLYHTYHINGRPYPEGIWVREVQQHKTRQSLGVHRTIIPNRHFPDGSCFYDYLASYLEGVWWPQTWDSKPYQGSDPRHLNTQGVWVSEGRSSFEPKDILTEDVDEVPWRMGFLFPSPKTGLPYSEYSYGNMLQINAHRLIGKPITPHTMRYIWATWGHQVGLTDTELRSLAYSMGHTVNTLRRMYAKLTPIEQQQPIEEAIQARLCQPEGAEDILSLTQLIKAANHLSQEDQQQLLQHLTRLMKADDKDKPQSA
jgi:hypothetical protein